jgi:GT2 family glycosyltransferase
MKSAILIPTYNRTSMVDRLLTSLGNCHFPPDVTVYVVENGSRTDTETLCERHSATIPVSYLYSPIGNKSAALNMAIMQLEAEFLIFFDDDIKVAECIVTDYIGAARRYGPGHFFGGPLVADAEIPCPAHLLPYLPPSAKGRSLADREVEIRPSEFDYFFGANWAAFHSDVVGAGLFATDRGPSAQKYSATGNEVDLQRRLIERAAHAIYLPSVVVYHFVPRECYTLKWIRRRTFRGGLQTWKVSGAETPQGRHLGGMPLWMLRTWVQKKMRLWMARFVKLPPAERTRIEVEAAYLAGQLYGYWSVGGWSTILHILSLRPSLKDRN